MRSSKVYLTSVDKTGQWTIKRSIHSTYSLSNESVRFFSTPPTITPFEGFTFVPRTTFDLSSSLNSFKAFPTKVSDTPAPYAIAVSMYVIPDATELLISSFTSS